MKNTEKSAVLLLIAALLMAASAVIFIFIKGFLYSLPLFAAAFLFTMAAVMFSKANKKDDNPNNNNEKRMIIMTENYKIVAAEACNTEEILALYKTHLGGPADWNEYYPNEETIEFDLSRNALFIMKNEADEIIAVISIDSDEEVDKLDCWDKTLTPSGEVSRLCVRKDMQNQGIARIMMQYIFDLMKAQGMKSVHILVRAGHIVALKSYSHLGFVQVGECEMFDKQFVCMEKVL